MDLQGARILVTGGAGFIGSELVRQLAGAGCELIVVDNLRNGRRENVEEVLGDRVRLHVGDIRDGNTMAGLLRDVDIVFHLACLGVRHSIHSPRENHDVNASATLDLLQAARAAGVARFVYVSSSEVYGTARAVPMSESHPTMPHTVYGASKLAGECYARAFHDTYGYPTIVVRPFNAYGPRSHHEGDCGEVIPKFLLRCLAGQPMVVFGDGRQSRDFTYVADTAAGILAAGFADAAVGQTINLGSGKETRIADLAGVIADVVGRNDAKVVHDAPRPGDVLRLYADSARARDLLHWEPRVTLVEGLHKLRTWYLEQGIAPDVALQSETVHNWQQRAPASMSGSKKPIISVAKPWMDERETEGARRAILSGWVTQGPEVAAFEKEFAAYVDAPYACAASSCTTALHLALKAVGVGPGDEVITVSHSFIATANAVRYCGALPVFVDIERDTFNLDPQRIEPVITPRTRAILCVHQVGMPCHLGAIARIARKHGLPVVEDAACAIGSEILREGKWEKIGRPHSDVACFSFHPRKLVTTGDGGMLTTGNEAHDRKFRLWRQHGMSVPDTVRHGSAQVVFESYEELGYNYRMTDIQAAVGREQLKRLPEMLERRRGLAQRYGELLAKIPGVTPPAAPPWVRSNWQSYCVRLPEGLNQRSVMQAMLDAGIATRRGVMCAHREPAYAHEPWSCGSGEGRCACPAGHCERLIESERAQDHVIMLPLYHQMTDEEQDRVVDTLALCCRGAISGATADTGRVRGGTDPGLI